MSESFRFKGTAGSSGQGNIRSLGVAYAVSAAAVGVAFLLRLAADRVLTDHSPFLLFVLPVVFAVLYAGRGPGILAGCLSLIAGFSFISENQWSSGEALLKAAIFVLVCGGIGWLDGRIAKQRRAARNTGSQLEMLLEGASEYAVFMLDADGRIMTWNSGAERILGWKAEQALGKHFSIFLAESDRRTIAMGELETARQTGRLTQETCIAARMAPNSSPR